MIKHGLERGKSKKETKARHKTLHEYYKETESKIKHDIEVLKQQKEQAEKQYTKKEILDSIFNDEFAL